MNNKLLINNKIIYTIAGIVICLQGACGIDIAGSALFAGLGAEYYGVAEINPLLVAVNVICGIVILGTYVFTGISALCRKTDMIGFGIAACALSYVIVIVRDMIDAACYGISSSLFLNILCLAVMIIPAASLLASVAELRRFMVNYNLIFCIAPVIIFVMTLISMYPYLAVGSGMLTAVEALAQISIIVIAGTVINGEDFAENSGVDFSENSGVELTREQVDRMQNEGTQPGVMGAGYVYTGSTKVTTQEQNKLEEHAKRTLHENNILQNKQINGMMKSEFCSCSYEKGELAFSFPVQKWQANRAGMMHGGIMCTAIDMTVAALARFYAGEDYAPTVSLDVKFIRPAAVGDTIIVKAFAEAKGKRISHLGATVKSSRTGKLLASAASVYMNVNTAGKINPGGQ